MKQENRRILIIGLSVLLAISGLLLIGTAYGYFELPKLVEEINNAAIGAIITAFITVMLLTQQTTSEEIKERNSKVFEKKLGFVETFLEALKNVIEDNQISDNEVNGLMFQLSYLRLHCSDDTVDSVLDLMGKLKDELDIADPRERVKGVSGTLTQIVTIFRMEIYPHTNAQIEKDNQAGDKISALLQKEIPKIPSEGMKYFILNTNKKENEESYHKKMLKEAKGIIWLQWKTKVDMIKKGDIIFLYSSGNGIVAAGASNGVVTEDIDSDQISVGLDKFQKFEDKPLEPGKIKELTKSNMVFIQTLFSIDPKAGEILWKEINSTSHS